jgi:hypothetical protein
MHAILHCANINILFWEGHAAELNSKLKSKKHVRQKKKATASNKPKQDYPLSFPL